VSSDAIQPGTRMARTATMCKIGHCMCIEHQYIAYDDGRSLPTAQVFNMVHREGMTGPPPLPAQPGPLLPSTPHGPMTPHHSIANRSSVASINLRAIFPSPHRAPIAAVACISCNLLPFHSEPIPVYYRVLRHCEAPSRSNRARTAAQLNSPIEPSSRSFGACL
jgi:hypothetical protein